MALSPIGPKVTSQALNDNFAALDSQLADIAIDVMTKGAIGTGVVDDTVAFEQSLLAGDTILVPHGRTFLIGDVELDGKRIIGGGTIKKKSASEASILIKGNGASIEGVTFDAEVVGGQPNTDIKLGDGAKNVRIANCTFTSKIYSAISAARDSLIDPPGEPYLNPVDGVIIANCIFKKHDDVDTGYSRPIYLHSVNNIIIDGNIIRDSNADAIRLRENDGNCIINGNQFINIGDPTWPDTATRDALDTYWSGKVLTITNNIVNTTAFTGFDIKGISPDGTYGSRKVIVSGNQIYGTRFYGIFIGGDVNYDGEGAYAYIDSVIISDNIIMECNQNNDVSNGYGIRLDWCSKYINIHDNIIACNLGRGIMINNSVASKGIIKNIKVQSNICVNNGRNGSTADQEAGIHIAGIDGVICTDNICENDPDLPNPYQATGIFFQSAQGAYAPTKTARIDGNICRNNLSKQIMVESSGSRADNVYSFFNNFQSGTGAVNRASWHDQRSIFFGSSSPVTGDGNFRRGDIIFNINPSVGGVDYWRCVTAGAPGTWEAVQLGTLSSVAATPVGVGFFAVSGGNLYGSVGTSSNADWKQLS